MATLLAAIALIGVAPLPLARGSWRLRMPRLALAAWVTIFVLGGLASAASLALAVVAVTFTLSSGGWLAPVALTIFGWVGLAAVGAASALAAVRNESFSAARRRSAQAMSLLAAARGYRWDELRGVEVCFVDAPGVTAMAVRVDGPRVVVGRDFADALTPAQLRAVLEHERAHLAGWHDRILRLAQLNRACFPVLHGARSFDQTVGLLIELVADDVAARRCGPATCADALRTMQRLDGGEASLLRARRLVIRSSRRGPAPTEAIRPAASSRPSA